MKQYFYSVFIILFLSLSSVELFALDAPERPNIISREEWGADESYTHIGSEYWQDILEARANTTSYPVDPEIAEQNRINAQKKNDYINENFAENFKITQTLNYDLNGGLKLAWPMKYTDYVNAIVIHHTHTEYESSEEGIKNIHTFHSLSREWGDIGYNYIIGYDGEIYEGRKGGDYVSAAHSVWNNYSTTGISVMGNYDTKGINQAQYDSLRSLTYYLAWQYGIDLNNNYYYHTNCSGTACDEFPLETYRDYTLAGHRDTGHTNCPGDMLYDQIQDLRGELAPLTRGFEPVKRGTEIPDTRELQAEQTPVMQKILQILEPYSDEELSQILVLVEDKIQIELSEPRKKILQMIKIGILVKMD